MLNQFNHLIHKIFILMIHLKQVKLSIQETQSAITEPHWSLNVCILKDEFLKMYLTSMEYEKNFPIP